MRWLVACAAAVTFSLGAQAYTFIPSSTYLKQPTLPNGKPAPSPWDLVVRYGVSTDYADSREPRGYDHVAVGEITYSLTPHWSAGLGLNAKAETIDGQIPKGQEQSYEETLSPGTSFEVGYQNKFYRHAYAASLYAEPLWDEESKLEGHRGLVGGGGFVKFNFFNKRFSMTHSLTGLELINTYHYNSNLRANPDYFWAYKWKNDLRLFQTWKVGYSFGAKVTRYLDDFVGYTYNNTFSLSKSWGGATATLSYDNGGFTDDGYVRLWYVDQYRRVFRLMVSYAF